MIVDILSIFPDYFRGPLGMSLLGKAQEKGLLSFHLIDIRTFAEGRHAKVDDRPFGGGPGMVMKPEPVTRAIRSRRRENSRVIYLSPQGAPLTAARAEALAKEEHLILLCGHYEGIDERALQSDVDEEISIGDYVLTSGCPAALVLVDAVARFIPGVIGHPDAAKQDSFSLEGGFDAPHYTRPEVFEGVEVPPVLRGGNHEEIARWRQSEARKKTYRVRPDLLLGEKIP